MLAAHPTPLTDYLVGIGLVAASGGVLGAMGGFILALLLNPIASIEVTILGVLRLELAEIPDFEYETAIAVSGAVGSIAILLLRVAEYFGLA